MPNKLLSASVLFVLVIFVSACCKKRTYCTPEGVKVYFTGFDRAQTRTVILKKYALNDTLKRKALDSSTFVYNGTTPIVPSKKDTVYFGDYVTTSGGLTGIYPGYVWTIYLPATFNFFEFTQVGDNDHRYEITPCKDKKQTCTLGIDHYMVNGNYRISNTAYLNK